MKRHIFYIVKRRHNKLPSAEMVGLSSGNSEFILIPKFSILIIVDEVMMFSFCCFKAPVSLEGWALAKCVQADAIKKKAIFFMGWIYVIIIMQIFKY